MHIKRRQKNTKIFFVHLTVIQRSCSTHPRGTIKKCTDKPAANHEKIPKYFQSSNETEIKISCFHVLCAECYVKWLNGKCVAISQCDTLCRSVPTEIHRHTHKQLFKHTANVCLVCECQRNRAATVFLSLPNDSSPKQFSVHLLLLFGFFNPIQCLQSIHFRHHRIVFRGIFLLNAVCSQRLNSNEIISFQRVHANFIQFYTESVYPDTVYLSHFCVLFSSVEERIQKSRDKMRKRVLYKNLIVSVELKCTRQKVLFQYSVVHGCTMPQ